MKRRYGPDLVRERMARLRQAAPDLVLSADVLVGFPTEDEAAYERAEALVEELEIAYPHVFPFSPRPETPGGRIPENKQVPAPERKARAARMRTAGERIRARVLERAVGQPQRVLVEEPDKGHPGWLRGRAATYLPVRLPEGQGEIGEMVTVTPSRVADEVLVAE
jgi:threonylcarbamoyladenosine tRNA methylthiotransferase MtaB